MQFRSTHVSRRLFQYEDQRLSASLAQHMQAGGDELQANLKKLIGISDDLGQGAGIEFGMDMNLQGFALWLRKLRPLFAPAR